MSKTIINIYGEGKGWNISKTKDERSIVINKNYKAKNKKGNVINRNITIGVQKDVVSHKLELLEELLKKNRGKVYNFFGRNINIKYSKKSMSPYIINAKSKKRDLISLFTFSIKDKSLIDISIGNDRGCVLEYAVDNFNKEISLITMTNTNKSNYIKFLFKTKKNKYLQYIFTQKDVYGNLELTKKFIPINEVKEDVLNQDKFEIIKFRPVFPTNIILCEVGKCDEVLEILKEKFNSVDSEIIEYVSHEDLEYIRKDLMEKGNKAVTVYYSEYDENPKIIDDVSKQFNSFKVINRLTKNGKLIFIKK